ncbi:MAG: response regulator transcription factor [Roseateles asaccharophilus]|uniref:Two-component system response regulator BasR n=1 Tax=Roseateles asaccharophilus TaxID=582607 RepID=A0A4R6MRK7_9BURK|nr:response regulator transcription factor [Roseateles asaccharophilus]MDN3546402.1 response regulator transcription factor [Roseateles asaccharophilus]TDP04567.1 two-component system response regulator BasR [Roseateles asaccharophilus]
MASILLLEDDLPLGQSLQRVLSMAGHKVLWLRTAADARRFLQEDGDFALLLLDITLPDGTGLDLLAWWRQQGRKTPVMMITARDSVEERVEGLDCGADDYLGKPFAMEEMLSRVRALLRRHCGQASNVWQLGPLSLDTARRRVQLDAQEVPLSVREYDILLSLAAEPGRVMTREQIERSLGGSDLLDSNAIDVHIYKLRKKLGNDWISTVRGVGYALEVPLPTDGVTLP